MYDDIVLPIFGSLSSSKCYNQIYYCQRIRIGTREVDITINLQDVNLTNEIVNELKSFFNKLLEIKKRLDNEIFYDFYREETVNDYIEFHIENKDKKIETLIEEEKDIERVKEILLDEIQLDKISIYPSDLENYAIFDYSIDEDTCNHVVVFILDERGSINWIGIES